MKIELTKIWLENYQLGEVALRADFSIDRHYRVVIQQPRGADEIARALHELAAMIGGDPILVPNAIELTGSPLAASPATGGSDVE